MKVTTRFNNATLSEKDLEAYVIALATKQNNVRAWAGPKCRKAIRQMARERKLLFGN